MALFIAVSLLTLGKVRRAAAIFVATVTKVASNCKSAIQPDGSVSGECVGGPRQVDLAVDEGFKGSLSGRVQRR